MHSQWSSYIISSDEAIKSKTLYSNSACKIIHKQNQLTTNQPFITTRLKPLSAFFFSGEIMLQKISI